MNLNSTDRKELRKFGFVVGGIFTALGLWLSHRNGALAWPLGAGIPLILLAVIAPAGLRPIHKVWMAVAHVVGSVQSRLLLSLVFFLVITPLGLIRRLFLGRNNRFTFRLEKDSYWIRHTTIHQSIQEGMRRQF